MCFALCQGYYPTEYTIGCFKAFRKQLDVCLGEFQTELDKLNDLFLVNCDKVLKDRRRHLIRRIQVGVGLSNVHKNVRVNEGRVVAKHHMRILLSVSTIF